MKFIVLILSLFVCTISFSQDSDIDTSKVIVVLTNGTERTGYVISDDGREILLQSDDLGKLYIQKSDIKSIKKIDYSTLEEYDGGYRSAGSFTTRYLLSTNALPIKKGENYVAMHLFGPEIHFAVSDRLSVGLMTTWITAPLAFALKYSIPTRNEKVNFGFGTLLGSSMYLAEFRGFGGLFWGTFTYGDRMHNVSISAGYMGVSPGVMNSIQTPGVYYGQPSSGGGVFYPNIPSSEVRNLDYNAFALSIGGSARIGKKANFVFDSMLLFGNTKRRSSSEVANYDATGNYESSTISQTSEIRSSFNMFIMPGFRFQKNERRAFQLTLISGLSSRNDGTNVFGFPMCSWYFNI